MKTVFKVPIVPPPKTPEAVPLEETPSRGTGKKSCSTLFSSSGDMSGLYTSGMDLFGNNVDDQRSPGKYFAERAKRADRSIVLEESLEIDLTLSVSSYSTRGSP